MSKPRDRPYVVQSIRRNFSPFLHGAAPTVDRFGQRGRACAFDGIDDFIELPDDSAFSPAQFTLFAAFKLSALPSDIVFSYYSPETGLVVEKASQLFAKRKSYGLDLTVHGGDSYAFLSYHQWTSHGFWKVEGPRIEAGNFYYQATVTYAQGILRLTVDGNHMYEVDNVPERVLSTEPLLVGMSGEDPSHPCFFNGVIDEVHIYDWAFTNDELIGLYQSAGP